MKSINFTSNGYGPRPVIQIAIIILILIIGIVSALMICEWLITLLLADQELNALRQNYGSSFE
ncbi:MAG TPA: hypothetical protein VK658_13565 [Chryseolinea sp.]|nr:hypothetical protein [Chryseolinea sp.]